MSAPGESLVFVVDDNPNNLNLLSGILRGQGYRVRMIDRGIRAVTAIEASLPDLVLLDITMPDIDGYEVCRRLKDIPKTSRIPVLFISALDEPMDKVKAFGAGGVDYVAKPFQAEEVLARVESHLKLSRLQKEAESRNSELSQAYEVVRRKESELRLANETIAKLSEPAISLGDTKGWARARSREIASVLGVREIGIWLLEGGRLFDFVDETTGPAARESGEILTEGVTADGRSVYPVPGANGQPVGAITIDSLGIALGDVEHQIVVSFARHLGTALELSDLRQKLAAAETRRAATRRELRRQGLATVGVCPRCARCFAEDGADPSCPDDGSFLDGSRLLPYRIQGRHRLEAVIGEGGMGTVFRAHDEHLKRDVAIKIIRAQHMKDPSFSIRLMREAETLARVGHPGVIALYDAGELPDGSAFFVMELLKGLELRIAIEEYGAGTPRQVGRLLRHAGAALAAVHRLGVIHRDIKPANIFLVEAEGGFGVKVMDFGVALPLGGDTRLTATGLIVGTPQYMAPEQASGAVMDERADIFSLASVVYEALLGCKTVRSSIVVDILVDVLYLKPPVPSSLRSLPFTVDEAFDRALAKRPEDRPRDVQVWAQELADLLEGLPDEPGGWPAALGTSRHV